MADKFSPEQVAEIVQALQPVTESCDSIGLTRVVSSLRNSSQTAFAGEDVDSIAAAISALEQPLESKPAWGAARNRGLFFVFEGLDRSGKSTQSKLLAKKLEEVGLVKWTCFPNRATAVGTLIDLYLRKMIELPDETVHQLFSANRWESMTSIIEALNAGTSVVCDRYAFSGVKHLMLACQCPMECFSCTWTSRWEPRVQAMAMSVTKILICRRGCATNSGTPVFARVFNGTT